MLAIRRRSVFVGNDVLRSVRRANGGASHHPTGADKSGVRTLCGQVLHGVVVYSSATEVTCKACTSKAKESQQ